MAITAVDTAKVVAEYQTKKGDTGSPEVQVALLTIKFALYNNYLRRLKRPIKV